MNKLFVSLFVEYGIGPATMVVRKLVACASPLLKGDYESFYFIWIYCGNCNYNSSVDSFCLC